MCLAFPSMTDCEPGLGKNLVVIVRKYEPNIRCGQPWRSPTACAPALDRMPVTSKVEVFGRVDVLDADIVVPSAWRAGESPAIQHHF